MLNFLVLITNAKDTSNVIYRFNESSEETNLYLIGFNKNINLFNFNSNINYSNHYKNLKYKVINDFSSTVLKLNDLNIKDDNIFKLSLSNPIYKNFSLILDNSILYTSDSRPIGNNTLSEVITMPGILYSINNNSSIKVNSGCQINKKMNIKSEGLAYSVALKLDPLKLNDELIIKSNSIYRRANFNNNRYFQQIIIGNLIENIFNLHNSISLNINYNSISQDYINFVDQEQINYLFEKNYVSNFDSKMDIFYSPVNKIKLAGNILFNKNSREKEYNSFNPNIKNSYFLRSSNASKIYINLLTTVELTKLTTFFNTDYETNSEIFDAEPFHSNLPSYEINNFVNIQKFNEFHSSKFRINLSAIYRLLQKDTLFINSTASIFHYDTPHIDNNDDYDESYSALYAAYRHRINNYNNFKIVFEIKNRHLVFLKAAKSAQSNSLKTIRLASEMEFSQNKIFQCNPKFDIIANYNVYDFTLSDLNPNTYSFRQISIQDSSIIWINNNNYINIDILLRYSERGFLNWEEFSELPLKSNFEQLYKAMVYNKINKYTFGIGIGYYNFDLSDLIKNSIDQNSYVISPEASLEYRISENSQIIFNGKYDFQFMNNIKRESINAYLKCQLFL